jgi:serine/threonine-protein kinase
MTTASDTRIGTTVAGYRIERLLGRGGMSVVYLAEDLRLGRRVALKLLAPELAADDRFRERFLRESRVAASLDHSNVIPIYEAGESDGLLYIAMRYVEGTELKAVIREQGAFAPAVALELAGQAASALDLAHSRGLVHRDVKPGNILLADEGGRGRPRHVYLSDFGLTKQATSESGLTDTGQFVGTAEYIAPEQIEHGDVGAWSDVYALACVLFECLTGEPPFRRDSLMAMLWAHVHDPPPSASERRPRLPRTIDGVMARGMAKAPRDRYRTCSELVAAAHGALRLGEAKPARRRPLERLARRPALALGGLALVAGLVALGLGLLLLGRGGSAGPTVALDVDAVQRIDAATGRLQATVPLDAVVGQIAAGPEGVWALDVERGGYWRIGAKKNTVAARGVVAGQPAAIATGLGSVWVANDEGATATSATITQIAPDTGRLLRALPFAVSQRVPNESTLSGVAVASGRPGSPALWVGSPFGLAVHRLRPRLGSLVATVPVGLTAPRSLAVGEGAVWVARAFALVRIDPARNKVAATIELPFSPRDVAAGAGAVWVANGTGDAIWVVDPERGVVVDRIPVGREPVSVAVGGGSVWVANRRDGTVTEIEPRSGRVIRTTVVGGLPEDVAVGAGSVWVAVHAAPAGADGRFSEAEYGRALRAIAERDDRLTSDAFQPITRALNARRLRGLQTDAAAAREVLLVAEAAIEEYRRIEPPSRFAADHARYLEGILRIRDLIAQMTSAVERRDFRGITSALDGMNTESLAVRSELSEEFKRLLRSAPLA